MKKILLVDDEPNIVLALDFLLTREGYQIEKAFDGPSGLATARNFCPDIVVLDVMMPGMDGFEVARRLRELPDLADVQIIFLTAKGTERDRKSGFAAGGEYYLVKPFDNDEFVRVVNELAEFEL